jgi:predicted nucleic-acid-binding Zn-ribbon protein
MSLQCHKCESRNTEIVSAKELSEKTGDISLMSAGAMAGVINPVLVVSALKSIFEALGKLFGYLEEKEKNNRKVIVCKDCGYWEKI